MDPQGAYTIMLADKGAFHPGLMAAFISMVGLYPPGTYVKLSDKRVGMVTEVSEYIDRPKVIVISSKIGESLGEDDQYLLNLSDKQQQAVSVDQLLLDYQE